MTKKIFKRIISVILVLNVILGCFSGCAGTRQTTGGEYMTKGEFFSLFISETGIYPLSCTEKEMESREDYEIEAETMVEWLLLSEDDVKKLNSPVTREIVAMSCVREMRFRTTHDIEIKDIKKCSDPQAIKDAVGMGLFELENGYFNANKKMTCDECIETLNKMEEIEATSNYPIGDIEIEYIDDAFIADEDFILGYEIFEEENNNDTTGVSESDKAEASFLNMTSDTNTSFCNDLAEEVCDVYVYVDQIYYINNQFKLTKGSVFVVRNALERANVVGSSEQISVGGMFAMRISEIGKPERILGSRPWGVKLSGKKLEYNEYIKSVSNDKVAILPNLENDSDKKIDCIPESKNQIGDFTFETTSDSIIITWEHTFSAKGDQIYAGRSDWMNAEASPHATVTAKLDNFIVNTDKFQDLLFEQFSGWDVSIKFDTEIFATAECGGLRYSPANNGNGGLKYDAEKNKFTGNLAANFKNARFTGASAKGSLETKIASIFIPIGSSGLSVGADLFFVFEMDGKISFHLETTSQYGVRLKNSLTRGWQIEPIKLSEEKCNEKKELEIQANIDVGINVEPALKWCGTTIVQMSIKPLAVIKAQAKFVSIENNISSSYCYTTTSELEEIDENRFYYCIDSKFRFQVKITYFTPKCWVGKFLKSIPQAKKYTEEQEKPLIDKLLYSCHYESDNGIVKECTHNGEKTLEKKVQYNTGEVVQIDKYKTFLDVGQCDHVSLTSVPLSEMQCSAATDYSGYSVESATPSVATGEFNHKNMALVISAVGPGSTEITLSLKESKWSKVSYQQLISVTVSDNGMTEVSFYPQGDSMDFEESRYYRA